MRFGQLLQSLRHKAKLSQSELAARTGISVRVIQAWEIDRNVPRADALFTLCKALDVDCGVFAGCWTGSKRRR
jgi:transcriptional regulator with XRE-family HTH domain